MSSPFPGMDPFLEDDKLWPQFHHQLVGGLHQLLPGLVDRYRVRVSQRHYVIEQSPSPSGIRQEHEEEFLEVRQRSDGRLVTMVDCVSPANKLTTAGRDAYLATRHEAKQAGANLVEIDLVLEGKPTLDFTRDNLPEWDYAVTVARAARPDRYEMYTATLRKRLPRFRMPLASDDRDSVMDLEALFAHVYDQGGFSALIDYRCAPPVPIPETSAHWLQELLRLDRPPMVRAAGTIAQGAHEKALDHETIARVAYQLWEREGRPDGRDREHWDQAVRQLRGDAPTDGRAS